jgi:hypothetical protein
MIEEVTVFASVFFLIYKKREGRGNCLMLVFKVMYVMCMCCILKILKEVVLCVGKYCTLRYMYL